MVRRIKLISLVKTVVLLVIHVIIINDISVVEMRFTWIHNKSKPLAFFSAIVIPFIELCNWSKNSFLTLISSDEFYFKLENDKPLITSEIS